MDLQAWINKKIKEESISIIDVRIKQLSNDMNFRQLLRPLEKVDFTGYDMLLRVKWRLLKENRIYY